MDCTQALADDDINEDESVAKEQVWWKFFKYRFCSFLAQKNQVLYTSSFVLFFENMYPEFCNILN